MRYSEIHGNKADAPPEALDATAGATRAAVGDNERATRLSGVCAWQAITVPYIISSGLALLYIGLIKAPSLSLAEPLVLRPRRLHHHRRADPHPKRCTVG